jgi:RNase P/RNase MRP subunit POP5
MPAKGRDVRWRYIAFRVDGPQTFPRNDFLGALLHKSRGTPLQDNFRITVYEGSFSILKVPHRFKDEAIELLSGLDSVRGVPCTVTPLRTSGTIKTLKERYRSLISGADNIEE